MSDAGIDELYYKFWEELIAYFLLIQHGRHRKQCSQICSIVSCAFVTAVLKRRCLATRGRYTSRQRLMGGIMKYAVEISSDVMRYVPSFIKNDLGIQKLIGGGTHTHKYHGDLINLVFFLLKMRKVGYTGFKRYVM
jgi:hypothetical protein